MLSSSYNYAFGEMLTIIQNRTPPGLFTGILPILRTSRPSLWCCLLAAVRR